MAVVRPECYGTFEQYESPKNILLHKKRKKTLPTFSMHILCKKIK